MKMENFLSQEFVKSHPREAARELEGVAPDSAADYLEEIELGAVIAILQNLEPWSAVRFILHWPNERIRDVLESLPAPQIVRILRLIESSDRERMLNLVSNKVSRGLRALLHYPDGTAASQMDPHFLAFPQDQRLSEVWKHLRHRRQHAGSYIYVVNPEGVLVGALGFKELISANPRESLQVLMRTPVESLSARTTRETIVKHPGWRRYPSLPVVDESGHLIGVIGYTTFRQMELEPGEEQPWTTWRFALTLGELYWIGSSGLLRGLAETMGSAWPGTLVEEKRDDR